MAGWDWSKGFRDCNPSISLRAPVATSAARARPFNESQEPCSCHKSGYMVGDLFVKWMKHFISSTSCNLESKVILILDGNSSHKKLEALELAKVNGVLLLSATALHPSDAAT
ncbi:unnamed protein product [Euphydryas editha]|uniref:DDE-1 domain-containing protein n=1 Tax=Euphydryas editha TaxID=104508 RepID=A0AAU9TTY0_EUPED|nr:unnamed protein product [Euphydryas editha]